MISETADDLYEGAVKAVQEFARACAFGTNDDRAQKGARLGSYLLALHKLAAQGEHAEQRVPLTEAELHAAISGAGVAASGGMYRDILVVVARAVEAAHGIKEP